MFQQIKRDFNNALQGEPEPILRLILIGLGIFAIIAAFIFPKEIQLGIITWFALP